MGNQIQILGLIIMFLLMVFYWIGKEKQPTKQNAYRYLLVVTYLLTLVDIINLIASSIATNTIIYQKLYLSLALGGSLTVLFYIIARNIKEKYCMQSSLAEKKYSLLKVGYFLLFFFHTLIIFILPSLTINPIGTTTFIILGIYFILTILSIITSAKNLNPKTTFHFWMITIIEAITLVLQYYLNNMLFLTVGNIVIAFYLYLTLENMGIEELESLRIENTYNKEQNIDKVSFLKNISHEIRTPINTIDGFSQIIMETEDIEEIKKDVADIRIASRDLIDVINGMIDLSIIESGDLEIIPENYNIYDVLDSIIEITKSKLREKDVELKVEIEKNIPEVLWGDSERISQIILNLLKNAIKYTEKGQITLRVNRIKSENICRLKIEVANTGRILKEEEIKNIFNTEKEINQSNLNLSVAKYLIEKMGGSLEVSDNQTKESCFTATLDQKIINEKQSSSSKRDKILRPFKATGKNILIVDDNKLNLKVAARLLNPYNVNITEAGSGQECLDILEQNHDFDLILMDDLMPGLSGTETMTLIKKIERIDGYYIPIVAVTANATSGQKEKYLENGFDDYLSKPINRYELDSIMKKYLKGNLSK